jgi:hypothetical protein
MFYLVLDKSADSGQFLKIGFVITFNAAVEQSHFLPVANSRRLTSVSASRPNLKNIRSSHYS